MYLNSIELQKEQARSSFQFTIRINLNANVGIDDFSMDAKKEGA